MYLDEEATPRTEWSRRRRIATLCGAVMATGLLVCGSLYFALSVRPEYGAQAAEMLRQLIGQEAVAQVEALVYDTQDQVNQDLAEVGLKQAQAPWQESGVVAGNPVTP